MKTQLLIAFAACSVALLSQEFEVASVKPANRDSGGTLVNFVPGGGLCVTSATVKAQRNDEVRQMVEALLKDRFQLKVHKEIRMLPVYSLVVAKMASGRRACEAQAILAEVFMRGGGDEPGPAAPGCQTAVDSSGPSLFTALQEQLGLRLEAVRGPVEVIVIDHLEKPADN